MLGFKNKEIIKQALIFKDLSTVKNYSKNNPLHLAVIQGSSLTIMKYLIENKCKVNLKNAEGYTPLHFACSNEKSEKRIINFFIENKADTNSKNEFNNTPLHYACYNTNIELEILQLLIKNKSDVNIEGNFRKTPAIICDRNYHLLELFQNKFGHNVSAEEALKRLNN